NLPLVDPVNSLIPAYDVTEGSGTTTINNVDDTSRNLSFTYTNSGTGNILVNGPVTAGTVALQSNNGSVTGSGLITASSLTATAASGIDLCGLNVVPTVNLYNHTSGAINYTSNIGAGLSVSGQNYASGGGFYVTENSGSLTVGVDEAGITTNGGPVSLYTYAAC